MLPPPGTLRTAALPTSDGMGVWKRSTLPSSQVFVLLAAAMGLADARGFRGGLGGGAAPCSSATWLDCRGGLIEGALTRLSTASWAPKILKLWPPTTRVERVGEAVTAACATACAWAAACAACAAWAAAHARAATLTRGDGCAEAGAVCG